MRRVLAITALALAAFGLAGCLPETESAPPPDPEPTTTLPQDLIDQPLWLGCTNADHHNDPPIACPPGVPPGSEIHLG